MNTDKTFRFNTTRYTEEYGDVEVYAEGSASRYYPATMFSANGDPGDPAEGGEVTYTDLYAVATLEDGSELVIDWESDDALDDMAFEKANEY